MDHHRLCLAWPPISVWPPIPFITLSHWISIDDKSEIWVWHQFYHTIEPSIVKKNWNVPLGTTNHQLIMNPYHRPDGVSHWHHSLICMRPIRSLLKVTTTRCREPGQGEGYSHVKAITSSTILCSSWTSTKTYKLSTKTTALSLTYRRQKATRGLRPVWSPLYFLMALSAYERHTPCSLSSRDRLLMTCYKWTLYPSTLTVENYLIGHSSDTGQHF